MSQSGNTGGGSTGSTGPPAEGRWTKTGVILTALGVVVAAVALLPNGGTSSSPPGPVPQTSPPFVALTTAPPTWTPTWTPAPSGPTADIPIGPRHVPGPGAPTAQPPPNGGPTLAVTPLVINLGDKLTINGAGFEAATGLHIRLFHDNSISYELGRDIVPDQNGRFTLAGPAENPGWCGSGVVAAFVETGSAVAVPDFSEAITTARVGIRC
jgi:hypothetical protein